MRSLQCLLSLSLLITRRTIIVMTDHIACMFYINRQDRARSHSMLGGTKIMELGYPSQHHHLSCMAPQTLEHHCGLTELEILPQSLAGIIHASPSAHLQPLGIPHHRPLCHTGECLLPSILFASRTETWIPGRCISHYITLLFYAFPPFPLLFPVLHKIQGD